ncbi:MAG: tetratricopeptide repeat protein [Leptolyngbyaceae cyanobacterium SL_7_1]|nr:tetratricopeptide repeat protein [Leptolyngbyaceae cyanobacterium SL_7_1]
MDANSDRDRQSGHHAQAIPIHQQSLEIARLIGDRFSEGTALGNLGVAAIELKEYQAAIDYSQQHRAIAQEIGDRAGVTRATENLAIAYERLELDGRS